MWIIISSRSFDTLPSVKTSLPRRRGDTHEHELTHTLQSYSLVVEGLDEQTGSVGTNINSC